jgi:hypothetical protein
MSDNKSEESWLANLLLDVAIFRHLFSIKALIVMIIIILVFATWKTGGASKQLNGEVSDRDSHLPISSVLVTLQDADGNALETARTNKEGIFSFKIQEAVAYQLQLKKEGYKTRNISDTNTMDSKNVPIWLRIPLASL